MPSRRDDSESNMRVLTLSPHHGGDQPTDMMSKTTPRSEERRVGSDWSSDVCSSDLGVLWAAKLLHPELFAQVDVAAQARQFYARFFGHDLNDAQIAHILRVPTA